MSHQPRPREVDDIHRIYLELARDGRPSAANVKTLRQIAGTICRRDGVEAIVLAGTDLTLIFSEASAGFPMVTAPPPTSRGSSAGR